MTSTGMRSPQPPTERGEHRGRPFWLWLPESDPPWPGMLILHGAGSRKENHGDFGRACRGAGWAALAYDQRGHGTAEDEMARGAVDDVSLMARFLAERPGVDAARICVRGSSMGGFMAIHAAAIADGISAAVAICPAAEEQLLRGLRQGSLDMRTSPESKRDLEAWLGEHDLRDAVALMGSKPLLLIHAEGDEEIPYQQSQELYERASEPKKLILIPGGHHRSAQHDAELQGVALRWLERQLGDH
jgi:fermentation-respiration switch protein FrsA (DUF1100 family)